MAGDTPREAIGNFLDPIRRSLSCITRAVAIHRGDYHVGGAGSVVLGAPDGLPLAGTKCSLTIALHYHLVHLEGALGPFKVSTASYFYAIEAEGGQEILAYHWHPQTGAPYPHLHLEAGAEVHRPELKTRHHLPTGRVSLELVILAAIEVFRATPLRDDWAEVLRDNQTRFETWRTWG